jgi:hypothetical protein
MLAECLNDPVCIGETGRIIKQTMEEDLPHQAVCTFPTLDHAGFSFGDPLPWNLPFVADVTYGDSWAGCKMDVSIYEDRAHQREHDGSRQRRYS